MFLWVIQHRVCGGISTDVAWSHLTNLETRFCSLFAFYEDPAFLSSYHIDTVTLNPSIQPSIHAVWIVLRIKTDLLEIILLLMLICAITDRLGILYSVYKCYLLCCSCNLMVKISELLLINIIKCDRFLVPPGKFAFVPLNILF